MSLRLLSDQCGPREITETPQQHRATITRLRDVLPICTPDPAVIHE
jgi:hypothetical protein